jgi:hypothetical protein
MEGVGGSNRSFGIGTSSEAVGGVVSIVGEAKIPAT